MKKAVSVILIIVVLINLIAVKSFADETEPETQPSLSDFVDREEAEGLITDREHFFDRLNDLKSIVTDAKGNTQNASTTGTTYMKSTIFSILTNVVGAIPQVIHQVFEIIDEVKHFTIYNTVMGNYELFNITYNDVPETVDKYSPMHMILKNKVIYFYYIIRNISIALILFILIYIGIRMAISTLATDKAKYKKMIQYWAVSLILVFLMHYVVIIISAILNMILGIIRSVAEDMYITETLHVSEIESQIFTDASKLYGNGWNKISAVFIMVVLIYYQLKFFVMYFRRIIEIGFLIIISPLVTVTYSIDKIGDGQAQAFKTWLNELIMKASIQVVHAILYLIFIGSAGYISTQHPLLAAVFFAFLSRSEKIVKNALSVRNDEFERAKLPFTK